MTDYHRKIVSIDRLACLLAAERRTPQNAPAGRTGDGGRARTKTIVQCHGCFDIVHPGHIRYLEFARSQGDILVVSITGDAAIDKGDQRPYIPQELRAENLAALEFVDYVVIDPDATACSLLRTIRPDIYVKGHEYATSTDPGFLAERRLVEAHGGRVIFSSGQVVFSSSRLVEAMSQADDLGTQRLTTVCRRHAIDRSSLATFLNDMGRKRILVLGDLVVERYVLCDATDVASESPMMSLSELDKKDYLGGAAIIGAQLAALGAEPVLVTSVGTDQQSAWAIDTLTEAGVEVRALQHRRRLAANTRFLVDNHKLFKVGRTAVCPLDSVGEREAADSLVALAAHADAAIIFDCGYGTITPGLLQHLGAAFRRRLPVLAGGTAGRQGNLAALRDFDLLCCSERRLRNAGSDPGGSLSTLAYEMLRETQAKQMIVTLGKRGLVTFDRRSHDRRSTAWDDRLSSEHLPSFATRVVDRLGCGEAVLAMATLALAAGATLMQAAYLADAAAAINIAHLGLTTFSPPDLRQWLTPRPELASPPEAREPAPVLAFAEI